MQNVLTESFLSSVLIVSVQSVSEYVCSSALVSIGELAGFYLFSFNLVGAY